MAQNGVLEIPQALYEQIVEHARSEVPNEACGVVAGLDGKAMRVYPMRNAQASPVVYRFDSREQARVFGEIEDQGWEFLGFFHSHPRTEAYPSATDIAEAHWDDPISGEQVVRYPETRYLIVSLMDEEPVLRAFRFDEGKPVEEDVKIT